MIHPTDFLVCDNTETNGPDSAEIMNKAVYCEAFETKN